MRTRRLKLGLVALGLVLMLGLPSALAQSAAALQNPAPANWPTYGRDLQMTRFSPLNQINSGNVGQLALSWSRALGVTGTIELSPVEYNGVLYAGAPDRVIALDATNGQQLWEWKTKLKISAIVPTMRGGVVVFNGNVYATTGDGRVVALNAQTGKQVWSTQVGKVDLSEGFTSEPIFAGGKVVVGPSGGDAGGVPGRVVALDPQSGEIDWTFNIVPKPGQPGFDTWQPPSAAQWGGGSGWTPGAYDPTSNTIVWGTGNANPWLAEGVRSGKNLYTASHVALDASTGKLKWYHQSVPNDQWDYDQLSTATIANLTIGGQKQTVAIVPTTTGFVYLVNVATGKFLKAYNMYKELTGKEGTVHKGYQADGTPIIDRTQVMKSGTTKTVCPFRWTSFEPAAFDPNTGLYYRPNSLACFKETAAPLPKNWKPGQAAMGYKFAFVNPPTAKRIGAVSAIDPTTGKVVWQYTWPYDEKIGVAATGGGVVFAASPDRVFRAFDAKTGKVLWSQVLTATMSTAPITYSVNGTQYVAVVVGGASATGIHNAPPTVGGSAALFVFALPH